MFRVSSCSCLCPADCQVLCREWRLCWSNADYIWVINNFIAYWGATYIRGLMVWLIIHATSTFWTNVVRCSYLSMPLISDFVYESSYLFEINSDPRVISEAAVSNINILNSRGIHIKRQDDCKGASVESEWRLKSPTVRQFVQQLIQANNK